MEHEALAMLETIARNLCRERMRREGVGRYAAESEARLREVFFQEHEGDADLRRSVLRLLDAGDCEAELEGTQLFYLGLQMGLELGRLNLWNQS